MKRDLFQFLPSEITINILSRLPVRTIAMSKCVCKSWLDLLSADDFVNSHLSKSVPALAVMTKGEVCNSMRGKVFEFDDGDGEADDDDVERRYDLLTEFDFPDGVDFVGAADGLLLLLVGLRDLHICNPLTRECIDLFCPIEEFIRSYRRPSYGFGSSRITGQHKAVQIIIPKPETDSGCKCFVYTLETGSWRSFEIELAAASLRYCESRYGAFVNGNLYWIESESITCFDLETECFSMFSAPPLEETGYDTYICALKDYLCVCAVMPSEDEDYAAVLGVWLMKDYEDEKCWTKEYVIGIRPDFGRDVCRRLYPIKVFKNGDVLISSGDFECVLFHYSVKTRALRKIDVLDRPDGYLYTWLLTPSFLSLESLGMEDVMSF